MPKSPRTLGAIIGRFQTDELTEGHKRLLTKVKELNTDILVFIGDRKTPPTAQNPLEYDFRHDMIHEFMPRARILPLYDHPSNEIWSKTLDTLLSDIQDTGNYIDIVLYTGRDGFNKCYKGIFPVEVLDLECGSTATRTRHLIGKETNSNKEFRRGIIYAMYHLPHRTYTTVDMAVFRKNTLGRLEMLVAQRDWEKNIWRFPGGFVEPGENFQTAARREFEEETGAHVEDFDYVGDFVIKDWRLRGATGVEHKTILMMGMFGWGSIKGQDDVARVDWVDWETVKEHPDMIVEEHRDMFVTGLIPYMEKHKGEIHAL